MFPKAKDWSGKESEESIIQSDDSHHFFITDVRSETKKFLPEVVNFEDAEKETKIETKVITKAIEENKKDVGKNRKQLLVKLNKCLSSKDTQEINSIFFLSGKCNPKFTNKSSGRNSEKEYRGSKYRGVSKNGQKFQIFIMINKKKRYFGVMNTEEHAAKVYDKLAIIFHGLKVCLFLITYFSIGKNEF